MPVKPRPKNSLAKNKKKPRERTVTGYKKPETHNSDIQSVRIKLDSNGLIEDFDAPKFAAYMRMSSVSNLASLKILREELVRELEEVRMLYLAGGYGLAPLIELCGCTNKRAKLLVDGMDIRDVTYYEVMVMKHIERLMREEGFEDSAKRIREIQAKLRGKYKRKLDY